MMFNRDVYTGADIAQLDDEYILINQNTSTTVKLYLPSGASAVTVKAAIGMDDSWVSLAGIADVDYTVHSGSFEADAAGNVVYTFDTTGYSKITFEGYTDTVVVVVMTERV